jgi:hypothetical protein
MGKVIAMLGVQQTRAPIRRADGNQHPVGRMRRGAFPRSRIVGGRSMWLASEVSDWVAGLKKRPLKGDAE